MNMTGRQKTKDSHVLPPVIVPAAGKSSRMGEPKALLHRKRGETFLEGIIKTCNQCKLDVVIVRQPGENNLAKELDKIRREGLLFKEAFNSNPETEMVDSFRKGLDRTESPRITGAFIWPVDSIGANAETLSKLAKQASKTPDLLVAPTYLGTQGHPTFIPRKIIKYLMDMNPIDGVLPLEKGMHTLLSQLNPERFFVETNDPMVLSNINRPEDLKDFYTIQASKENPS